MRVIPVASGKGGVGKSLVAANLAVSFAQAGKRVVLADLDLGASNLHLIIGHQKPGESLGSYLLNPQGGVESLLADTGIPNLRFIPGDSEIPGSSNLKCGVRSALIRRLLALENEADILILDLGAGAHQSILDFFLASGRGIVVTTPAVTATLGAYIFLKNTVFRLMYTSFTRGSAAWLYLENMRKSSKGFKTIYLPRLLDEIEACDAKSHSRLKKRLDRFRPRLILNMLEDPKDADVAMKMRRSCASYLGVPLEHLGVIYRDSVQEAALSSRLPVVLYKKECVLSQAIYRIADKILQTEISDNEDSQFNSEEAAELNDAGFEEASLEAALDFENKKNYVSSLLHSGDLTEGELLETVKTQQLEITKIKKENNLLKHKLTEFAGRG